MPLFSSPSEVNPICPSAWLHPKSVITITWEIAAEMLQEWALFYMLRPLKKMFIACMFSQLSDILFLKNHCWLEDQMPQIDDDDESQTDRPLLSHLFLLFWIPPGQCQPHARAVLQTSCVGVGEKILLERSHRRSWRVAGANFCNNNGGILMLYHKLSLCHWGHQPFNRFLLSFFFPFFFFCCCCWSL